MLDITRNSIAVDPQSGYGRPTKIAPSMSRRSNTACASEDPQQAVDIVDSESGTFISFGRHSPAPIRRRYGIWETLIRRGSSSLVVHTMQNIEN